MVMWLEVFKVMSDKFRNFLENLAIKQFDEGARNYLQNPAYANRCNKRFQLLTDVSKLLKGGK